MPSQAKTVSGWSNGSVGYHQTVIIDKTSFGFTIPTTATIKGIMVTYTNTDLTGSLSLACQLIKGGTAGGSGKQPDSAKWDAGTAQDLGGATDLWGLSLAYSDVNASNFGVRSSAFGVDNPNSWLSGNITITVYYDDIPAAFALTTPSNAATDQAIAGTLAWDAATGATSYDVYLDQNNPPTTKVSSSQAGCSYAYSGLDHNAVYYWKVVAKNATGNRNCTANFHFTTIVDVPAAFALTTPSNGATGQAATGTLAWDASTRATAYDVFLDKNNPPTTKVSADQAGASYNYTGLDIGFTYYWKVVAKNVAGTIACNANFHFDTAPAVPGAFALTSPVDTAANQPVAGTLVWGASSSAATYDVFLDKNSPPTTKVSADQVGLSYNYSGLDHNATYYWKVVAKNMTGNTDCTANFHFGTIVAVPGAFALSSPANAAVSQAMSGTLSWDAASDAATYDVFLDKSNPPTTKVSADQAGVTFAYGVLDAGQIYYWKVVAKNLAGDTDCTGIFHFTTILPSPGAFVLSTPADAAIHQAIDGTISWAASQYAAGYDVYLDQNNPPTTKVSGDQAGLSYNYAALLNGHTYRWKVVAKNATSNTDCTSNFSFVTIDAVITVVGLSLLDVLI